MVNNNVAIQHHQASKESTPTESSIKWCTVSLHEILSEGNRLDANVFDLEAKHDKEIILSGKYPITTVCGVQGLASAYTCARFKRIWVKDSPFPIYQPTSILDLEPTPDGYISKSTNTQIDNLRVHEGQILMTCSGTIGNVSYVSKTLHNLIFSHDLLRIDCKCPYDAGYLYTYFKTTIGNKILTTNTYGAVVSHIEPEHLGKVIIPNPPDPLKCHIHNLIIRSYALRDESNALRHKATALLYEELHLPPISQFENQLAIPNVFTTKLSAMAGRFDATYHTPIVDAIIAHLQKYARETTSVGDNRVSKDVILPGRFKRVYVDENHGRVFIGGKQIGELDPCNKKYLSISHHEKRIKEQLELHPNMTLITCSGTIGKVTLVGKHWDGWTANQHIIRILPANDSIAGYLNIFLASAYGYKLITRFTYGAVVDEIDASHVRQIAFPLLKNQDVQKTINDLALEANEKRYEAYCLEQQAIQIMNEKVIFAK